jgi:hypothetical protein
LRYEEESTWEEKDNQDTIPNFTSFQYNQDLKTTGSGINLKFGAIFRPADAIRIGVAIHSPLGGTVYKYSASTADYKMGTLDLCCADHTIRL